MGLTSKKIAIYLTWCLVVGSGGQRQEELGRYHLTGLDGTENRLFKSFISGNLVGTDYMNGPNGALDWVGSRIRHNFPRVHPKDLYTIRDKVRHLGSVLLIPLHKPTGAAKRHQLSRQYGVSPFGA